MDRGAWQATVHAVAESDMTEATDTHTEHTDYNKYIHVTDCHVQIITDFILKYSLQMKRMHRFITEEQRPEHPSPILLISR